MVRGLRPCVTCRNVKYANHRRGRRPRRPFRRMTDDGGPALRAKGARAVPAKSHTLGGGRYREHRGKRGCKRSRRTSAAGQARQTRNARAGVKIGCRVQPAPSVDRRRAHRGRCALRRVGNVSALQIRHPSSNGRGVGDAAPYGLCDRVRFSGAVRYGFPHPSQCMPQVRLSSRP